MADYKQDLSKITTTGAISTPELSSSLKVRRRAISDSKQAFSIIRALEEAGSERNQKNARINAKYNAERPHRTNQLEADGLGWKSNFSTKPLAMLIDKVAPRFVKTVESTKYLTNSALQDDTPGAAQKTEAFRREITKTIRSRAGWNELVAEIAQENALFGYTSACWLDEFHWFPRHFRQDAFFVPTGTKQLPAYVQVICLRESPLIHELFESIEEKEAAETAGWNISATVQAINTAMPENRKSQWSSWERVHEDLVREANVGTSHESGSLVVPLWHILAQEVTGKVSHYIYADNRTGANKQNYNDNKEADKPLFEREDQFPSMEDALALFCYQQGNGKLHGSKGIGREVYSMAAMLDRVRNEVVDRLNLSGKLLIQCDDKAARRFKMSVIGNAMLIGQGYEISERKLDAAVEPFLSLDTFLTELLDQLVGATSPRAFAGDRTTKAEVDIVSSREEESRDNILSRWMNQFARFMTTVQRRMCDKDVADEDAQEMQKRLLKIMDRKELDTLAKQPVAETVKDFTEQERQQVALIAAEARGNPLYNQKEVERRKLISQIDEEFANAVLLPDEDPTVTAEQTRMQQLELLIIAGQGAAVPVSPRDAHIVHLQVLMPAMEEAGLAATKDPAGVEILHAMHAHAKEHVGYAESQGTPPEMLEPFAGPLAQIETALVSLQNLAQQEASLAGPTDPAAPPVDPESIPSPSEPLPVI